MATFFIQAEPTAIGPFTGVELREAALARVIGPQSMISNSPEGPWTVASDAGLFSDAKIALPHPDGTYVPSYLIRGAQNAQATGPFKLRELIGFAVHGMLRKETFLKSELNDEWFPVTNIHMLRICLRGQFVLKAQSQTQDQPKDPPAVVANRSQAVGSVGAGEVVAKPVDVTASNLAVVNDSDEYIDEDLSAGIDGIDIGDDAEDNRESGRKKRLMPTLSLPKVGISPMQAVKFAVVLIMIAGIGTAYSFWRSMPMQRDSCIGDWIGTSEGGKSFGVSFREDGSCVVFNADAESWTGDFVWSMRTETNSRGNLSYEVEPISDGDTLAPIGFTDGHLRFQGFVSDPPMIGNRRFEDCFLRLSDGGLQIAYLSKVKNENGSKVLLGGWRELTPLDRKQIDPISELSAMEPESRPANGVSPDAIHLADAVLSLQSVVQSENSDEEESAWSGLLCYSKNVDAEYLLTNFGMPDEARRMHKFEIAALPQQVNFADATLVRYGQLRLVMTPKGEVRFVSIVY